MSVILRRNGCTASKIILKATLMRPATQNRHTFVHIRLENSTADDIGSLTEEYKGAWSKLTNIIVLVSSTSHILLFHPSLLVVQAYESAYISVTTLSVGPAFQMSLAIILNWQPFVFDVCFVAPYHLTPQIIPI